MTDIMNHPAFCRDEKYPTCVLIYGTPKGSVSLYYDPAVGEYTIAGPSGSHRMHALSTDVIRLHAHLVGFLENNGVDLKEEVDYGTSRSDALLRFIALVLGATSTERLNQGDRTLVPCATTINIVLCSYEMPRGREFAREVYPDRASCSISARQIALSKRWKGSVHAMALAREIL